MATKAGTPADGDERLLDAPTDEHRKQGESRSDADMLEDIRQCLEESPFDTGDLRVHVQDGVVHLSGTVESKRVHDGVLDIIGGCSGGLVTQDKLRIGR